MSSWLPVARPVGRRGTSWLVAACVLVATLGGLGAAAGFARVSHGQSVLVLARTVLEGQLIADADLGVGEVDVPGAPFVTVDKLGTIVGTRALTTLVAGALLVPGTYGQPSLQDGMSQVTLRLAPSQRPTVQLPGGLPVWLLGVPRTTDQTPVAQFDAIVVFPPEPLADGDSVMDVAIASDDVPRLAPFLSNGTVTLVVADE